MKAKKLFIITNNFGNIKAGPVIRFMRYAPLFAEKGVEVTFLTRLANKPDDKNAPPLKVEYFDCADNISLTRKALEFCSSKDNANVILFSVEYKCYEDFQQALKYGIKLIYVSTMSQETEKRSWLRKKLVQFVLRRVYGLMDVIVSSSEELSAEFGRLGIDRKKLISIPNGVDTNRFAPLNDQEREKQKARLGIDPAKKVLLFVGLFIERKGVSDLFSTWKQLNATHPEKFHLCMVGQYKETGENSPEFVAEWPVLKRELEQMPNVSLFPFSETVQEYFEAADAFVFYSRLEGMPNVFLEAMASGLAIFTHRFEGFSAVYGDPGEHYFFLNRDPAQDASSISGVLFDGQKFEQARRASREKAVNSFSIDASIERYYSLMIPGSK